MQSELCLTEQAHSSSKSSGVCLAYTLFLAGFSAFPQSLKINSRIVI
jgi:hypothetical protein